MDMFLSNLINATLKTTQALKLLDLARVKKRRGCTFNFRGAVLSAPEMLAWYIYLKRRNTDPF